jgi:hypothetical protein
MASRNAIENLIHRGLTGVGDETTPKIFLQGLRCSRGSLPQDPVGVFGDVFDLHTRHGAILAPLAPKCKYSSPSSHCRFGLTILRLRYVASVSLRRADPTLAEGVAR